MDDCSNLSLVAEILRGQENAIERGTYIIRDIDEVYITCPFPASRRITLTIHLAAVVRDREISAANSVTKSGAHGFQRILHAL